MWKYLKITVTAVSLLACVLAIVLWVRSYYRPELVCAPVPNSSRLLIGAWFFGVGEVRISRPALPDEHDSWGYTTLPLESYVLRAEVMWELDSEDDYLVLIRVPGWFLATIAAIFAALPWIKSRFSLRTLLIVMTLLAVFSAMIGLSLQEQDSASSRWRRETISTE